MKLHYLVGRLVAPFASVGFYIHHLLFKTPRARVVVWNERGELLLVRNWAGKQQWGLPGGGIEKHERPADAARRELYEETGINVAVDSLRYVGVFHYKYEAPIFAVTITADQLPATPHNPWEITAIGWFAPNTLPHDLSPLVSLVLKDLSKSN